MSKVSEKLYSDDKDFLANIINKGMLDLKLEKARSETEKFQIVANDLIEIYEKSKQKTWKWELSVKQHLLPSPDLNAQSWQASLDMVSNSPVNSELDFGKKIAHKQLSPSETLGFILEVAVGNMLGDGSLVNDSVKAPAFVFSIQLTSKDDQYIKHLYNVYSPWTTSEIYDKKINKLNIDGTPAIPNYAFITHAVRVLHTFFVDWRVPFCDIDNKKIIKATKILPPWKSLEFLLTPRALAYWYMDDGSWTLTSNSLVLCTDGFTITEVELLISVLQSKYQIPYSLRQQKNKQNIAWRIFIGAKDTDSFYKLVEPYILPCFRYKLK